MRAYFIFMSTSREFPAVSKRDYLIFPKNREPIGNVSFA